MSWVWIFVGDSTLVSHRLQPNQEVFMRHLHCSQVVSMSRAGARPPESEGRLVGLPQVILQRRVVLSVGGTEAGLTQVVGSPEENLASNEHKEGASLFADILRSAEVSSLVFALSRKSFPESSVVFCEVSKNMAGTKGCRVSRTEGQESEGSVKAESKESVRERCMSLLI
jgi:hypothetical protein